MQLQARDHTAPAQPAMLPRNRRQSTRHTVTGRVTSLRLPAEGDDPEAPKRINSLELRDMSHAGVGAQADEPIDQGARLALFFPPHGNTPGFDLYGTVVRCERKGALHEVGIAFDADNPLAA